MAQVCTVLVKNLARNISYDLLLGADGVVQEAVHLTKASNIDGLEYVSVLDQEGRVVAHSDTSRPVTTMSDSMLAAISEAQDVVSREYGQYYEFFYPIRVTRFDRDLQRKFFVGVAAVVFSKEALRAPIRRAQRWLVTAAALVAIFSTAGIYLLAKKMTVQIRQLSEGARQVGRGNLDVAVRASSKDELGQLATEFNNMVAELREKFHMQKFVSKLTVQMLRRRAGHEDLLREGERRRVTILFSDVRGFTAVTQRLEPEKVVKLINVYFDVQTRVIERHGGIVDKFIGDQIMAIFEGEGMEANAVRAGVEIQTSLRELNDQRRLHGKVILEVGIGINQGPAVVGNMGSKNRMDYTVIGDVVNLAARLCALARPGQIIAAESVINNTDGEFRVSRSRPIRFKGLHRAIDICEIDCYEGYVV
jgi:adenylate cyclase